MLGKISIVGFDTILYQRISLALWNLIMAASIDYTERCHIVLVCFFGQLDPSPFLP